MPATVVTPGLFTLKLGLTSTPTQSYECEMTGFHLQSNPVTTSVPASFCKDGYDDVGSVTHAVVIDFLGFMESATALWYFLWDNSGKEVFFEFAEAGTGKIKLTGSVRAVKPPFDAIAGQVVSGTVTLPVLTGPTIIKPTTLEAQEAPSDSELVDA